MRRFRLNKQQILRSGKQFTEVFAQGKRLSSKHFVLIFLNSTDRKVGFAVSRQTGNAVNRNRAKRRMRELYRLNQHLLPENVHVVIVARPGTERAKSHELQKELLRLFREVNSVIE